MQKTGLRRELFVASGGVRHGCGDEPENASVLSSRCGSVMPTQTDPHFPNASLIGLTEPEIGMSEHGAKKTMLR